MKKTVLLLGYNDLVTDEAKSQIPKDLFKFVNPIELKLNDKLKEEVTGVLLMNWIENLHLIYELPNLQAVSTNSSGTDHLDTELLRSRHIKVLTCSTQTADSTSNTGIALLLMMTMKIKKAMQVLHNPTMYHSPALYFGQSVRGKTLAIVGLGAVGQCMANKARVAFGMNVVYHQRNKRSDSELPYYASLDQMLEEADVLLLSCSLTKATKNLINFERMKLMKRSAILINIARGAVVNTDDLVEALRCGIIAGAGLDVTDPEPLPVTHPLLFLDNVVVIPHIGTHNLETENAMVADTVSNLAEFLHDD